MNKIYLLTLTIAISAAAFGQSGEVDSLPGVNLEELVVTGQYEPQSLKKSVYQVRVIDKEFIQLRAPVNVQTILNTQVGIRFTQDASTLGTSDISLLGMTGQNVKILLDGVPLVDRGATRESLNQIDINTVERIEIVEGPMSVVYGTDALAGVINIITKKGTNDKAKLSLGARIMEETVGDEYEPMSGKGVHNESVNAQGTFGKWNAGAGLTRNIFGGSKVSMEQRWLPKDQYLGNASLGYNNGQGLNVWYRLNYVFENIKTPGLTVNQDKRIDKEYISNRYTHQAQGEWKASDRLSFNGVFSYQDYSRRTRTTEVNVVTGQRFLVDPRVSPGAQDIATFNTETMRLVSAYKISRKASLQAGTEINLSRGNGDRIDGDRSIGDYALFASTEFEVTDWFSLRPGVRLLYNSQYSAPPAIPSLNSKFKISEKLDFRVSYARGFRAPALRELYFSFFDASHSLKGNPDLKAEFSNSFNGSFVWQALAREKARLRSTIGLFHNTFHNMIDFAIDPSDPTGTLQTYTNVYMYKTVGFTLANAAFFGPVEINLGGSYIGGYNDYSEDDSTLPQVLWSPEINTNLVYRMEKIGASVSLFYKWTGVRSRYQVGTNTTTGEQELRLVKIDPYQWSDITLTKQLGKLINVGAGVKNLFDVKRIGSNAFSGGAHSDGASLPVGYGRSYFISLNFQWDKQSN